MNRTKDILVDLCGRLREVVLPALGSSAEYQLACIVAGNQALQDGLIEVVQRGSRDLRTP